MKNNFNDFVSRPREVICILFDNVNEIEGRIVVVKHLGAVSIGDHVHDCTPKETQVFYSSLDTTTSSTICIRGFIARTQNSANLMYPPHNTAKLSESYQKSEMYLLTICGLSI